MNVAITEKKPRTKRSKRPAPQSQQPKRAQVRVAKSNAFPWKMVFGVFAILGVMTLLFSPNDPNSIKAGSSGETSQEASFLSLAKK